MAAPRTDTPAPAPTAEDVGVFFADVDDVAIPKRKSSGKVQASLAKFESYVLGTPPGKSRIFPDASKTFRTRLSRAISRLDKAGKVNRKHFTVAVTTANAKQAAAIKVKEGAEIGFIHNATPATDKLPEQSAE